MIVIGAKGHAKEIFEVLNENKLLEPLYFFDNYNKNDNTTIFDRTILKSFKDVEIVFSDSKKFCIGVGNPYVRFSLAQKFINRGGSLESIISKRALIGKITNFQIGVNIMPFSALYNYSKIGKGVLINSFASVHHDCEVGDFTELSPGSRILGRSKVGAFCSVGANSVVLPDLEICDNVIIGAGAVVTKSIFQPGTYLGIPAKKIE